MPSSQETGKPGLRERKKAATRKAISDVATALFIQRGFEAVTLAEVAEAAGVSVNTIFNYFSTKEELFFDQGDDLVEEPTRVVRERRPGETPIDALARVTRGALAGDRSLLFGRNVRPFLATVEASPALRARERVLYDEAEERLTAGLIDEGVAAPRARIAAALVIAAQWRLVKEFRARLLADEPEDQLRAAMGQSVELVIEALRDGLGGLPRREEAV